MAMIRDALQVKVGPACWPHLADSILTETMQHESKMLKFRTAWIGKSLMC